MSKFYIKVDETNRIVNFYNCNTTVTTEPYIEMNDGYVDDLLCGYYRYIDGHIVRDETLYQELLTRIAEQEAQMLEQTEEQPTEE